MDWKSPETLPRIGIRTPHLCDRNRADVIYGLYQDCLKASQSPVSVRGIIAEEEQHLAEMDEEIATLFDDVDYWKQQFVSLEE